MLRRCVIQRKGVHTVTFHDPKSLPVPCAQRWTLRLAKARLFKEFINEHDTGSWQLQDDRHMSPEFNSFVGYNVRGKMRPGLDDITRAENIVKQRLPTNSHLELEARRDIPMQENMYYGKMLYDTTFHGCSMPSLYRMRKDLNKGLRNDKKVNKKYKGVNNQGSKSPPSGWEPIPDGDDDEE